MKKLLITILLLAAILHSTKCSPEKYKDAEDEMDYDTETTGEDVDEENEENAEEGPDDEEGATEASEGSVDGDEEDEEQDAGSESEGPTGSKTEEGEEQQEDEAEDEEEEAKQPGKQTKQARGAGKSSERPVARPRAPRGTGNGVKPLSDQEKRAYWTTFDYCLPKMRGSGGLEQKLVSGDIEELEYYDKCTILCFFYDNWIVEGGHFKREKLKRILGNSNGSNLESVMSECIEPLPSDCNIAYKIYKCFYDKNTPVFFQNYSR